MIVELMYYLIIVFFFDIRLLYYYINLRLLIVLCLSSGDINLSLGIFYHAHFVTVSKSSCGELFETFVILSGILLPSKLWVASPVFAFLFLKQFEVLFLNCIFNKFLGMIKRFLALFTAEVFTYLFTYVLAYLLSKRHKP